MFVQRSLCFVNDFILCNLFFLGLGMGARRGGDLADDMSQFPNFFIWVLTGGRA